MRSFLVHTTKFGRPVKGKRAAGHNGGRKVDPKRRKKQLAEEAAVEAAQLNQEKVFSFLPSPPLPTAPPARPPTLAPTCTHRPRVHTLPPTRTVPGRRRPLLCTVHTVHNPRATRGPATDDSQFS